MADDFQVVAMEGAYLPYERPPQPQTLWSAIPRGLQSFVVATVALDAKALNDRAFLNLNATLPPNFGYVMADMMVTISQDNAADWDGLCNLSLQNFYRVPSDTSVALRGGYMSGFTGSAVRETRTMTRTENSTPFPTFPIIGVHGTSGILISIGMVNSAAAAATQGTINAYISFWQFDLEQIRKYPINAPIPVHSR